MFKLYKGRYLIAIYDQFDRFIDCATSIKGLKMFKPSSVYSQISREQFFSNKKYKVVLIDCLEQHDDIFAEEDKIFLQEHMHIGKIDIYLAIADKYGKSLRTIQRWIKEGRIDIKKEEKEVLNVI